VVADLDGAPVTRRSTEGPVDASRRSGRIVAVGPELFLTADPAPGGDGDGDGSNRAVRLAAGSTMWIIDVSKGGERRARVSIEGDVAADWTWAEHGDLVDNTDREAALAAAAAELTEAMRVELPDLGPVTAPEELAEPAEPVERVEPPEPVARPWAPTHAVGDHPLAVAGVPSGVLQPGTTLPARLPVEHVETTPEGWALVECENGWRCYVDPGGLRATTAELPSFFVAAPVEGRTDAGDPLWLVPGERYPRREEAEGWTATEVGGLRVWVPSWAAGPGSP
jgi:hypothetical protein